MIFVLERFMKMTHEDKAPKASQGGAGENEEPSLTAVEIGRRAYEIFVVRGSVHGYDLDDWLKAEHELKEKRTETGKAA
jgi:Protein of unknown function (DUF2934)